MKHKFYLFLLFSIIISPAFANLSVTINNPVANQQIDGGVDLNVSVSSTYDLISVYARTFADSIYIGNKAGTLSKTISVANEPTDTVTIRVFAEDILHNKDSATVTIIRIHHLQVIINTPVPYQSVQNNVSLSASVASTYNLLSVYARVGGDSVYLGNTAGTLTKLAPLTNAPDDTITIKVIAEDILHNKDSATVKVIKDLPPRLNISGTPGNITRSPLVHIHVEANDAGGDSKINVIGPAPLYLPLSQGINVIDTVIDISGVITNIGYQQNIIRVLATDSKEQVTTAYVQPFYLLTSSYLKDYHKFEDSTTVTDYNFGNWLVKNNHAGNNTSTLFNFNNGDSGVITTCCAVSAIPTGAGLLVNGQPAAWHAGTVTNFNHLNLTNLNINGNYAFFDSSYITFRLNLETGKLDSITNTANVSQPDEDNQYTTIDNFNYKYNDAEGDVAINRTRMIVDHEYYIVSKYDYTDVYTPEVKNQFSTGHHGLINNHRMLSSLSTDEGNSTTIYLDYSNKHIQVDYLRNDWDASSIKLTLKHDFGAYTKHTPAGLEELWLFDTTGKKFKAQENTHVQNIWDISPKGEIIYTGTDGNGIINSLYWADTNGNKKTLIDNINGLTVRALFNNGWYIILNGNYVYTFNATAADSLTEIKREAKKDSAYSFKSSDFDKAFISEGSLFEVKLTGLPKYGTLYLGGKPLTVVDTILRHAALNLLSYKPNAGYLGKDTLYWNGSTGDSNFTAHDTLIEMSVVETLPVTLTNLKAEALGKVNLLSWQTTQEINSSYFEVQKSLDGNNFSPIGKVQAQGNSSIKQDYRFTDGNPVATAKNYYRIKVVDRDGKYSFTKIVWLKNNISPTISLYPNPAKTNVQVSLGNIAAGRYSIVVYTTGGRAVVSRQYTLPAANQQLSLPVSTLAPGVYLVKITADNGAVITTQKIVKE